MNYSQQDSYLLMLSQEEQKKPLLLSDTPTEKDILHLLNDKVSTSLKYGVGSFLDKVNSGEGVKAQDFLNEVTYKVQLNKIYKVIDSCYYHQEMPYCPIIVEKCYTMKKGNDKNYQLQVWDKKGEMVYCKSLRKPITTWFVNFNTLVYKPELEDQESNEDCYYIIALYKNNQTIKVDVKGQEFGYIKDPVIGYCNKCLYISKGSKIFIINTILTKQLQPDEVETIKDFSKELRKPYEIDLGYVINHSFIVNTQESDTFIIICCETSDNQIDFSILSHFIEYSKTSTEIKRTHSIKQIQEVVKRQGIINDPIHKFKVIYTKDWHYALVLRQSGQVDFYWNYNRINYAKDKQQMEYSDIDINFEGFFLKSKTQQGKITKISLGKNGKIGLQIGNYIDQYGQSFDNLFHQKIQGHVNFYHTICLINTSFIIAHQNKIFIFDIVSGEQVLKLKTQKKIMKIFRNAQSDETQSMSILFSDGSFNTLDNEENDSLNPTHWVLNQNNLSQVQYISQEISQDIENNRFFNMITKQENNKYSLQTYSRGKVEQLEIEQNLQHQINQDSFIIPMFTIKNESIFMVISKNENSDFGMISIMFQALKINNDGQENISTRVIKQIRIQDFDFALFASPQTRPYLGLTTDQFQNLILISKTNIYKLQNLTQKPSNNNQYQTITVIKDLNIQQIHLVDEIFLYAIIQNTKNNKNGLVFLSYQMLLDCENREKFQQISIKISNANTGANSLIDFGQDNQRFTFLRSFCEVSIIPLLHRSTLNFMGMQPRQNYLATKKIKDHFLALDRKNRITVWNVANGKLLRQVSVRRIVTQSSDGTQSRKDIHLNSQESYEQYCKFDVFGVENQDYTYQREWYQPKSLIFSKTQNDDSFLPQYFLNGNISNEISGGQAYIHHEDVDYLKFKLIEIGDDEQSIIEHMEFTHQYYKGSRYQKIFISQDNNIMIEILVNLRVLIYVNQKQSKGQNVWKLERRFQDFPHEIAELSQSLFMFTPDLARYVTYDKFKQRFMIKSTLSSYQQEIPLSLMDARKQSSQQVMKRFKWVDNYHIIVCNEWGLEKLVQIDSDNFIDVSSSKLPAFSDLLLEKQIYTEAKALQPGYSYERLLRKFRSIKREQYLFKREYSAQLYDDLFSIDYNVEYCDQKYVADLSFTYIYWKLIEDIENEIVDLKDLERQILIMLSFNILPGCQTILHKLAGKGQTLSQFLSYVPVHSPKIGQTPEFEIPFIQDVWLKTPLHYCFDSKDYKNTDFLLQYLANAQIDHHSKSIVNLLPKLISQEMPSLMIYLDSRLKSTPQIGKIDRGTLKNLQANSQITMISQPLWSDQTQISEELFVNNEINHDKDTYCDIDLKFLDLPDYHFIQSESSLAMFEALKDTSQLEIFELKSVRYMIDYLWPYAKHYTLKQLLYPFVFYLATYWTYTNIIDDYTEYLDNNEGKIIQTGFLVTLCGFSIYFLQNEMRQIRYQGITEYFSQAWNYIDFIPPLIIILIATISFSSSFLVSTSPRYFKPLQAIGSLLMWLKLLYFLRISRQTGYLIRMIVKVIQGMKVFMFALTITIVAFADAFINLGGEQIMIEYDENERIYGFGLKALSRFFDSCFFTYRMILGDVNLDIFDQEHLVIASFLVLFCTLFVMIVMLNLLISIVGQVFGQVQDNQVNEFYQEKAIIISENSYLIPQWVKEQSYREGTLLLIARKIGDDYASNSNGDDEIEQTQQDKNIESMKTFIEKKIDKIENLINQQSQQIKQVPMKRMNSNN